MLGKEKDPKLHEVLIPLEQFLQSFNRTTPAHFPQISKAQLLEFKKDHESFFKNGNLWSLDQHRKRVIDWLLQNIKKVEREF
jgi:hypothetical protein